MFCENHVMAVQALFHPNSFGFCLGLTSLLGCHETWMGDSNLIAVGFVINQTRYVLACEYASQHSSHAWAGERDAGLVRRAGSCAGL